MAFLWVPWRNDAGYSWLWSKPKPRAIQNDIVADTRERWNAEYRANDLATVGEKWVRAVEHASPQDKDRVRQEAKRALERARAKQEVFNLSGRKTMSDEEVLDWLGQRDNFQSIFPEKGNLDESARKNIMSEWKQVVLPAKEWNERIRYANVDYRRIGMELAALTGLFALGLVLTPRRT